MVEVRVRLLQREALKGEVGAVALLTGVRVTDRVVLGRPKPVPTMVRTEPAPQLTVELKMSEQPETPLIRGAAQLKGGKESGAEWRRGGEAWRRRS